MRVKKNGRTFLEKIRIEIKRKKKMIEANKTPTERVTADMVEFYDKWAAVGRLSTDGKELLWQYFEKIIGQKPVGEMSCGGCVKETWAAFEREIIRYKNKPL